jgi:predicted nucleotide-binding protein (sugar kinase/HSP70/actin superfamily)
MEPVGKCQKTCLENLSSLLKETEEKIQQAWQAAWQAQLEFNRKLKEQGKLLLERSIKSNQPVWIISGRPYLLYDNYINLNFWFHLEKLGLAAIPVDYLPLEEIALSELPVEASAVPPWRYSQKMFKVASWCRSQGQVFPVFLSNYGCGIDGFSVKHLKNLTGGIPYLMLEFDEHRGEAGLITRIEAFADEISQYRIMERKPAILKRTEDPENLPPEEVRKLPFFIPYFADHARAFAGALKKAGIAAEVLPQSDDRSLELGEKYTSGKECHAYAYLLGDLLKLVLERKEAESQVLFFPGARYSCLLQQYGPSMRNLLLELGKTGTMVLTPSLDSIWKLLGFDALKSLWQGLVAIDDLCKIACQLRPYELNPGETDRAFKKGLKLIEQGMATDQLASSLKKVRVDFRQIKTRTEKRPVIGIAGDIYTRQNSFANNGLFKRLEELGCEVWPSPFLVDEVDFTFSRGFYEKLSEGNLKDTLIYGGLNLVKEIKKHQVRRKLEFTELKIKEPDFKNLLSSTMAYLNYNSNQSLFLNVARMIDFARKGADGVINVICFNCMLGTVSAAISGRIKKEFGNLPLPTLIYGETESDSTVSRLEAFVEQVQARFRKKNNRPGHPVDQK